MEDKESKVNNNGIIVVTEKLMGKKDYHQHKTSCKSCFIYCSVLRNFAYSTPLWLGYKQKATRKSYKNARLCCRPELKLLYEITQSRVTVFYICRKFYTTRFRISSFWSRTKLSATNNILDFQKLVSKKILDCQLSVYVKTLFLNWVLSFIVIH